MPALTVFADFDHDGRISKKPSEQAQAQLLPGLILLPNIDADGKKLPAAVTKRPTVPLDYQRTRSGLDRELAKLVVVIDDAAAARLRFELIGPGAAHMALFDRRYKPLTRDQSRFDFAIAGTGSYEFWLESSSLPGTPLAMDVTAGSGGGQQDGHLDTHVAVNVDLLDARGQELAGEQITVSTAPVIFADNGQKAQRIYICDIPDQDARDRGNLPSVTEVGEIVKTIKGVDFVIIPAAINHRDAWIQDQFQQGYCHGATGVLRVIVHLPRLRSNVVRSELQSNLATFVAEQFPSTNLGLFQDFYAREMGTAADLQGNEKKITFMQSYELSLLYNRVGELWGLIRRLYPIHLRKNSRNLALEKLLATQPGMSFFEARRWLKTAVGMTRKLLAMRQLDPTLKDGQKERLGQEEHNLLRHFELVEKTILLDPVKSPGKLTVRTETLGTLLFSAQQANRLDERQAIAHSSLNYGGNLEVSGPVKDAPLGKVVLGTHRDADPDLLHFLRAQRVQPLVDVDTSWLEVAHVDEILAFLPATAATKGAFTIAVASPQLAMQIIDAAWATHVEGGGTKAITAGDDIDALHVAARDMTVDGKAPLTRMLRGRYWLHHNPPQAFQEHRPPQTYLDMLEHYPLLPGVVEYFPEPGPDRYYEAVMSVREFRYFGRFTNDWLAENHERTLQEKLARAFPGIPQVALPVLYDEVPWGKDPQTGKEGPAFEQQKTSAFLPNAANLQVVDQHLLIPRPFGPRAAPAVAAQILKRVLPGSLHGYLNPAWFARRKLDLVYHWIKRPLIPGSDYSDLYRVADQFRDGFPGLEQDEIRDLVYRANRIHFQTARNPSDGGLNLTKGWHRLLIPEATVDLFEACIYVQLAALGLHVHFVDSWYYHIRLGEIHCGTNVLRAAPTPKVKWWEQEVFATP